MAVPIIDGIDWNDFHYSSVYQHGQHFRGIFEWGFLYKESEVPKIVLNERKYDSEPYRQVMNILQLWIYVHYCIFQMLINKNILKFWNFDWFIYIMIDVVSGIFV